MSDLDYYGERLRALGEDLGRLLALARDSWQEYRRLCERTGMRVNPLVARAGEGRVAELAAEIHDFRAAVAGHVDWPTYLDRCEAFRVLVRDLATVATTHDWQSPAYESSVRPHVFQVDDHGYRGILGYRRVHHPFLTVLERRYRTELGYDDGLACYLTSSGMGAFTVVENWLARDRLRDGDLIAYMARTYFEARDQLSKLKGLSARAVDVAHAADVVDFVNDAKPAAFLLEPINNEDETTLIDVTAAIRGLGRLRLERDLFFVVDTSMSGGGEGRLFDIEELRRNPRLHLVQIESLLKYRQHGLDRVNAGVVLVDGQFSREVFVQRERCGAFLPDVQSFEMLAYTERGHDERMRRIKRNGEVFCAELREALPDTLGETVSLSSPIAATHPNHAVYQRSYRYLGGVIPLSFRGEVSLEDLQRVIASTLDRCRRNGTVVHHSTSFGFSATHLGIAATGGALLTRPFLRVSAGEDPVASIQDIARSLAAAMAEHLTPPESIYLEFPASTVAGPGN